MDWKCRLSATQYKRNLPKLAWIAQTAIFDWLSLSSNNLVIVLKMLTMHPSQLFAAFVNSEMANRSLGFQQVDYQSDVKVSYTESPYVGRWMPSCNHEGICFCRSKLIDQSEKNLNFGSFEIFLSWPRTFTILMQTFQHRATTC